MKIWIFGQSMSLPFGLTENQGWPYLLSQLTKLPYKNFACAGMDNFFIYHTFLENIANIDSNDIVIIGWSHPSRKSFVLDRANPTHLDALDYSLHYSTQDAEFIRSKIYRFHSKKQWKKMAPISSGLDFYDVWFKNYYSEYEQKCNFRSYLDSVRLTCPGKYIPFYFSKESVETLSVPESDFMLDFVIDNNVAMSDDNYHLNDKGHILWANHLFKQLDLTPK